MRFGVFDHLDRDDGDDLGRQYRDRLRLVEAYDRVGLHAYHLAEHHGTPLGLSPSPSVFLAAVAQRTRRLRFGPLVYQLALHHPLRVLEEVCMLDQLSGGRLELGVGRGVSPIELGLYGVDPEGARDRYEEALEILLRGMAASAPGGDGRLDFAGRHYAFAGVPVELAPVQRPHPPLWYGAARPDTAAWAAERGINIVSNGPATSVRAITDRYRAAWAAAGRPTRDLPLLGMNRHVVVADTDAEALDVARPAYARWHASLTHLWRRHGVPMGLSFPEEVDDAVAAGFCIAGSPSTVRDRVIREVEAAGVNYLLCRLAFGSLPLEQSLRSVDLLAEEVLPALPAPGAESTPTSA